LLLMSANTQGGKNMVQSLHTEDIIKEVVEQADRACQAAVEVTPPAYRGFLMFLSHNKKAGGTKANPIYASVRAPYMGVDGRVKMAMDDHREAGASLVIQTAFEVEPHSGQLVCRAVVTSALLGSATAHARVFLNGGGVDATNPLENAETSAVGRALGFLGYGLYGTGIASAEEVLRAVAAQESLRAPEGAAVSDSPPVDGKAPVAEARPPSDRQREFLRTLLERAGASEEEIAAQLAALSSSREASLLIKQLREQFAY
jgi:hypothetical protein